MTLFVCALIALAFIIGFRAGKAFADAGYLQARLLKAFDRDRAVSDAADMNECS